ncbi:MAG: hypothetical protein AB8U53_05530 [Rickettsia aeschlimannii]
MKVTCLEQLNKKLAKASDPKEKINLEKAITNLEENAKSNPMTLKKAGINQDDAEILLANIHLLYKEGFNKIMVWTYPIYRMRSRS